MTVLLFALIAALLAETACHLLAPPAGILALSESSSKSSAGNRRPRNTAIPSYLLPFSPSLIFTWWRLAWQKRSPPWKLASHVFESDQIDWHAEQLPEKVPLKDDLLIDAWQRGGVWSEKDHSLPLKALRRWENIADPLADQALSALMGEATGNRDDNVKAKTYTDRLVSGKAVHRDIAEYRSHVTGRPPRGAGVIPLSWYAARDRRRNKNMPAWLEDELTRSYEDLIPRNECEMHTDDALGRHRLASQRLKTQQEVAALEWDSLTPEEQAEELAEEKRLIKVGQDFFYRYSGGILLSLLHFSLAGGFASPRLSGILKKTGYLVPPKPHSGGGANEKHNYSDKASGDRTWKRLMETTQWVLDVMERSDALDSASGPRHDASSAPEEDISWPQGGSWCKILGGVGRQSSVQVRLLHARVRRSVTTKMDFPPRVLPLNQTDLLSTLLSFSAAPLASLSRMGLDQCITPEEREAYLGIWRYAGWLMGVDDRLVRRCLLTPQHADRALWSCVLNLFSADDLKDPATQPPTYKILQSIADRPPFHRSFELHSALTTSLVGTQLSDALGLPRPSLKSQAQVYITYLGMFITITFGHFWRRGWDAKRILASKKILRRLIVWNLDFKRSLFTGGGSGDAGTIEIEKDPDGAQRDVAMYRSMIREMIGVCVALVSVVLGIGLMCRRHMHSV